MVLLISLVAYRGRVATERHAEQLGVTERTVSGINGLLLAVTNAGTGQRGYLLTGEDIYLEPYHKALADMPGLFKALEEATMDRPKQIQRIAALKPIIDEKLEELKRTIGQDHPWRGLNKIL